MPHIIPIRDLKNTGAISQMCQETNEPIFVTKNGYGAMVIMNMQLYERGMYLQSVHDGLQVAESDIAAGKVSNAKDSLNAVRNKYDV